ncbi:MAG: 30S ribosome-binding factor RbfA [Chitinophagales bacterium]|nr:30S ribosome-binding factor RbfA [Chitinophagales bacterium]
METIKQKKIAKLVKEVLSDIFQRENLSMAQGGMMTISHVTMSPDLLIAKIYLSLFQIKDQDKFIKEIEASENELRHKLGNKIRNQVRRIPELHFYLDDSLEQVFRIEEIFKQIKKNDM